MKSGILFLALAAIAASLSGCSSSKDPPLVAATGVVTFQGKPLGNATVVFIPDKGLPAMGKTDSDGKFTLSTGTRKGVGVGPAKATVTAAASTPETLKQPKTQAEADAYMKQAQEMQKAMAEGRAQSFMPVSLIPEKYGMASSSGLSYTISNNPKDNHFKIEL